MDRLRQEATEAGLKDGLKKALQMLDAIRARFIYLYLKIRLSVRLARGLAYGGGQTTIERIDKAIRLVILEI